MPPRLDDRWLWLGFGVFVFVAVRGIRYAITDLTRLTKIDPYQYEPRSKDAQQPEDTISLEDLKVLAESPHPNIANAATSLIVSRFVRQRDAYHVLTKDLESSNEETRRHARQAIFFLRDWPLPPDLDRDHFLSPQELEDGQMTPSEVGLTDLSRRLMDGLGGALGRDDEWVDSPVVPSAQNPVAGWTNVPRERPSVGDDADETPDMQRRRRREAMVLHEGPFEELDEGSIVTLAS